MEINQDIYFEGLGFERCEYTFEDDDEVIVCYKGPNGLFYKLDHADGEYWIEAANDEKEASIGIFADIDSIKDRWSEEELVWKVQEWMRKFPCFAYREDFTEAMERILSFAVKAERDVRIEELDGTEYQGRADEYTKGADAIAKIAVLYNKPPDRNLGCPYCRKADPLDSGAEKWLFDETVDLGVAEVAFGTVIHPDKQELGINVVTSPVITKELLTKSMDIKFCPMCGREL